MSDDRNSGQLNMFQGSFQSMGYSKHSRPRFFSNSRGSGHDYNSYNNEPALDKPKTNAERNKEKDEIHYQHQALKVILNYYNKTKQFSGGVDKDGTDI